MRANQVKIQRVATAAREYDAITVVIGGLHLRCDAVDGRTIRLAKKLADDHEAWFFYDDATAEKVRNALGIETDIPLRNLCEEAACDKAIAEAQKNKYAMQCIADFPRAHDAYLLARFALAAAENACLEKHVNGNFKHDTREECAEAIRQIAIK